MNKLRQHIAVLQSHYDYEYPGFPRDAWKAEVATDKTVLGYWEWAVFCLEAKGAAQGAAA